MQRNLKFKIHKCSYDLLSNLKPEVDIPSWQFDIPSEELYAQATGHSFVTLSVRQNAFLLIKCT
jgi:hypothetical protein